VAFGAAIFLKVTRASTVQGFDSGTNPAAAAAGKKDGGNTMSNLTDRIMSEIESGPRIDAKAISLDVQSQGLFKKRKIVKINGQIVKRQTGDRYDIADKLVVG
jgi:hypothetical protein